LIRTGLQTYVALALATQTNGQVLVGAFRQFNGVPRKSISRLKRGWSVDGAFSVPNAGSAAGNGAWSACSRWLCRPDGRVVIGGDFTIVRPARRRPTRCATECGWLLDETFDPGCVSSTCRGCGAQPDGPGSSSAATSGSLMASVANCHCTAMSGRLVGSGLYPGTGLEVLSRLIRSFGAGPGASEPDSRIIWQGFFDSFDGVPRKNIGPGLHQGLTRTLHSPTSGSVSDQSPPVQEELPGAGHRDYNRVPARTIAWTLLICDPRWNSQGRSGLLGANRHDQV